MKFLNKLLIIFSIIFVGCQNKNMHEQKGSVLHVDIDNAKSYITDEESGLFVPNECELVQMNCPTGIGTIEDMKFDKDKMILLDNGRQRIHILNKDGVCEHEIYRLGKASNEYIEITDFFAANDKVYIYDMPSMKIVEYDYEGQCKGVTDISDYWANHFFVIGEHFFLINELSDTKDGKKHIFEIRKDGTLVKSYLPFEQDAGLTSDFCFSFYSKDSVFYAQRESNTIYKVTSGKCEPFITLDFGKYNLPDKFKYMDARELLLNTNREYEKYALGIEHFQSSGNLLFVNFTLNNDDYLLVINHKTKTNVLLCKGIAVNSMYHLGLMHYYFNGGSIYNLYDGDDFALSVKIIEDDKEPIEEKYLRELKEIASERATDPGNPIIVKYKIKHE